MLMRDLCVSLDIQELTKRLQPIRVEADTMRKEAQEVGRAPGTKAELQEVAFLAAAPSKERGQVSVVC